MKYIKNKNQFPKVGFNILLWIGLLHASFGQALGQAPETAAKSSETGTKPSGTAEPEDPKTLPNLTIVILVLILLLDLSCLSASA